MSAPRLISATVPEVLEHSREALERFGRVALAHVVRAEGSTPGKPGWKMLLTPDGVARGNLGGGAFEALVLADLQARLAGDTAADDAGDHVKRYYLTEDAVATKGEPTGMVCGGMLEVFLEVLEAPPLLVICGGGPVGQAVAAAGHLAGFDLLVADDRPEFRRPELFPEGAGFAAVDRDYREDFLATVAGRELAVAIVSRCWETDTAALAAVLRQAPERLAYLGLMGSRRKIRRVRSEVEARGHDLSAVLLHAPIGLPIGGDSPGEIAVSILAEIVQVRHRGATASGRNASEDTPADAETVTAPAVAAAP